ncbi:unnamed protein product [Cuscuta campestris]|uniref:ARGOS-like protein n=1 Tax=Cuscuta campestris TaxID=132261 RepID=A0A484NGF5_9ASTE|nr:unnamed protein product [Cuscuta campestris]
MILAASRGAQENYYFLNSLPDHRLIKNATYGAAAAANMKVVSKKAPPPSQSPAAHQRKIGKRTALFSQLSYFGPESLFLLLCLTASLLLLPLVLPPLPPPPLMLLFVPICILAVLMILAFMPCNVRDVRYPRV